MVAGGQVRVRHGAREVAVHALAEGRRRRILEADHLAGIAGVGGKSVRARVEVAEAPGGRPPAELLRPLAEYEAVVGGSF